MPLKKIDNRIRTLVENGVSLGHRSLCVVVGDHGRDQVVILHHMLSKAVVKARPSVLWCYKKELGFSSHRKKRMRKLQKKLKSGSLDVKEDDPFELFIAATDIRYCYYAETHKVLGNTYGMCVLQDFEALTPNLLARTVETVEGGGLVVIMLRTMQSLRQLFTMTMDVHARYRTEAHQRVIARFNERFLLSLADCSQCIVLDDHLNVLPISSHTLSLAPVPPKVVDESAGGLGELQLLKKSLVDTQPVGHLVSCCKTLDQAKALLKIVEGISEQTLSSTVAVTASRGRGKSATLGLALAAAVAFGYSNIFVTSPSPENLCTLFEFVLKGFDAVAYREHEHYDIIQSTNPEFNRSIVRINIFQQHRQTIQYIQPGDAHKLEQAELVCIDEAAAIPLPLVKQLMGSYLVLMASTVNGYEGTGRSLSLKLIEDLRVQSSRGGTGGRVLREVSLTEPIRYAAHDPVEAWLHQLLCLDVGNVPRGLGTCPTPEGCSLYYVNRDTLFCYHKASEAFLQHLMSLYVSSHYKNSPNDLQLLSDAPAHHVFVLLGPVALNSAALPKILCVLQVCLEGAISRKSVMTSLSRGKRASGDLIPWTLSQQFSDHNFAGLSGVRVVRIATHPDFQGMGYGTRAMRLLADYYSGKVGVSVSASHDTAEVEVAGGDAEPADLLHEVICPRKPLLPLLSELSERQPEAVDYIGVSFGLTAALLRFWSQKNGFVPVYLRQTANELTGEHSCIMLKVLMEDKEWLDYYSNDFRSRYLKLLGGYKFRAFSPSLALGLLKDGKSNKSTKQDNSYQLVTSAFDHFSHDLKRLEQYTRNMADYHLIVDLLPSLSRLYFTGKVDFHLDRLQAALLLGMGLQYKTVDMLHKELDKGASQLMGHFNRIMHKFVQFLQSLEESHVAGQMADTSGAVKWSKAPLAQSMDEELSAVAQQFQRKGKADILQDTSLAEYAVTGAEEEWTGVLDGAQQGIVSVKKTKLNDGNAGTNTRGTKTLGSKTLGSKTLGSKTPHKTSRKTAKPKKYNRTK